MLWKTIRLLIIVCITWFVVWCSRWVYITLYDLLDFQITLYTYLLATQDTLTEVKSTVSWTWNSFLHQIWAWNQGKAELLPSSQRSLDEQVAAFANKLQLISGIISAIVGMFLWKILFDMVFGIKSLMMRLTAFVNEPVKKI